MQSNVTKADLWGLPHFQWLMISIEWLPDRDQLSPSFKVQLDYLWEIPKHL